MAFGWIHKKKILRAREQKKKEEQSTETNDYYTIKIPNICLCDSHVGVIADTNQNINANE